MTVTVTDELLDGIRAQYNAAVDGIRADPMLSPAGKQVCLADAYDRAHADMERMREANDDEFRATRDRLQRRLFTSSQMVEYRTALGVAAGADTADAALELLERARITGDDLLVKAIATVASQRGWTGILHDLAAKSPERAADLQELAQAEAHLIDPVTRVHLALAFMLPDRPAELAGLDDMQLAALRQDVDARQAQGRRDGSSFRADVGVRQPA